MVEHNSVFCHGISIDISSNFKELICLLRSLTEWSSFKGSAGEEYALEVVCSNLGWGAESTCAAGWNNWENEGEQELYTIINDYYSLKESVKPLSSNVSFQWQKENCTHYQNCALFPIQEPTTVFLLLCSVG